MDSEQSVTQIISASKLNPQLLAELERFRRKVTIMFTDIKGSTSYFEKHGDIAGLMMVHECNDLLKQSVERHKGRFIKTIGDAVMAMYDAPDDAVRSAIEMQKSILEVNLPKPAEDRVTIRIGLNFGTGIVKTSDVFGDVVNVASRVESVSQPEQIVISDTVYEAIAASGEFRTTYLGRFALKGKEENRDLYDVAWKEAPGRQTYAAHAVVQSGAYDNLFPTLKLQQLRQDGTMGAERKLKHGALLIGSEKGDFLFSGDPKMAPTHARISIEGSQVFVEDLSEGRGVYVRLVATYTLQDGDEIVTGAQRFKFNEQKHAVAAAAATGTKIVDMQSMLDQPVAELVSQAESDEPQRYPLLEESVTWGRNKGTYVFPEDRFMSRTHARVYQRGEDFFLEDLGSRNGTFVRVRGKAPVPIGTSIRVGGQILRVTQ